MERYGNIPTECSQSEEFQQVGSLVVRDTAHPAPLKTPTARPSASKGTPSFASDQRMLATWNAAKARFQRVAYRVGKSA